MVMPQSPIKIPVILTLTDESAAFFKVSGLSVLERNLRHLQKRDSEVFFLPIFNMSPQLVAMLQKYQVKIISETEMTNIRIRIFREIAGDAQYSLVFFDNISPTFVAPLLKNDDRKFVERLLENKMLDEIYQNTQGWIARLLNKKISFAFTRLLVKTSITPNQITVANLFFGLLGCLFLMSTNWSLRILGASIIQFHSIIDGCDGEVARLKVVSSRLGAWLDTIGDDVVNNAMFFCLSVGVYRTYQNETLWWFCLASSLASLGMSFFIYYDLMARGKQNAADFQLSWAKSTGVQKTEPSFFDKVKPILKRDFVLFFVALMVILDARLVLVGLFAPIWIGFFLYLTSFMYGILQRNKTIAQ